MSGFQQGEGGIDGFLDDILPPRQDVVESAEKKRSGLPVQVVRITGYMNTGFRHRFECEVVGGVTAPDGRKKTSFKVGRDHFSQHFTGLEPADLIGCVVRFTIDRSLDFIDCEREFLPDLIDGLVREGDGSRDQNRYAW